jgi:multicomponent Na+:H+ antiporter subunit B
MTTVIAQTVTRAVVPIIMVISTAFLLQGHNLPGGGFIAGVMTAVGVTLLYVVYSVEYVESTVMRGIDSSLTDRYRLFAGVGLAVAAGTGITAMAFGLPFLSQDHWLLHGLPVYGDIHIASAFIFDLGVYLVVTMALLTIIAVVGEE